MLQRFAYTLGGAALTLALVIGFIKLAPTQLVQEEHEATLFAKSGTITNVSENAFGPLGNVSLDQAITSTTAGRGGGGVALESATSNVAAPSMMKIMPPYYDVKYRYVYKGDPLDLSESTVDVLKRESETVDGQSLINTIKSFDLGLMSLKGFSDLKVQNISLEQSSKFGYVINVNFPENIISIYQNWQQWDNIYEECNGDSKCIEGKQIKYTDIPEDGKILEVANAFIKQHNIDTSAYGDPIVQRPWAIQLSPEMMSSFAPEEIQVLYPLLLEDQTVVEQSGYPAGLNVSVNIRYDRVSNLNNLRPEVFSSSSYEAVTDAQAILDIAENGGIVYPYYGEAKQIVDVEIGTPKRVLMRTWRYNPDAKYQSEELYVPALQFPIIKKPEGEQYFYQEVILVPLAKDLIDNSSYPTLLRNPDLVELDAIRKGN